VRLAGALITEFVEHGHIWDRTVSSDSRSGGGSRRSLDAALLELIEEGQAHAALEPGEPDRIGLLLFATMQGIAALVAAGSVSPEEVATLVACPAPQR
jgi:hypothetical protein